MSNPELSSGFPGGYLSTLPHLRIPFIGLTTFLARSAHMYATGLCRRDSLSLPLPYEGTFRFRDVAQKL